MLNASIRGATTPVVVLTAVAVMVTADDAATGNVVTTGMSRLRQRVRETTLASGVAMDSVISCIRIGAFTIADGMETTSTRIQIILAQCAVLAVTLPAPVLLQALDGTWVSNGPTTNQLNILVTDIPTTSLHPTYILPTTYLPTYLPTNLHL